MKSSTARRNVRSLSGLGLAIAAAAVVLSAGSASAAGPTAVTDLEVTNTITTAPAAVGDPIAYSITVTNHGPDQAGLFGVQDVIPAGVTGAATSSPACSVSNGTFACFDTLLAPGASRTYTLTGTASQTGTISNTATVTNSGTDPNPANDSATATVSVLATPVASPWMAAAAPLLAGLCLLGYRVRTRRVATL